MTNALFRKQVIEAGIPAYRPAVRKKLDAILIQFVPKALDIVVAHLANHNTYNKFWLFGWNFHRLCRKAGVELQQEGQGGGEQENKKAIHTISVNSVQ